MDTPAQQSVQHGPGEEPQAPGSEASGEDSNSVPTGPLTLKPLGAKYQEKHHEVYFHALKRVIDDEPSMKNIAVTGAYGTGKSSVLGQVAEEYPDRVLELSLSTVACEQDVSGIEHRGAPASSTTNRIQKEIVKQILYGDHPSRTRESRFRRISRFRWVSESGLVGGAVALVFLLLFLSGQSGRLVAVADGHTVLTVAAYGVVLVSVSALVVGVRWVTHNRIFLEKLSAGPATVALAPDSMSYFDQYMDEIVYYFEASGRDIVIFEDIDRFDDPHIFETLRSLNTLLNGSAQVRYRKGHSAYRQRRQQSKAPDVKFIYALRDSVFERLGASEGAESGDAAAEEIKRANRTKFFDLVIPIVPFITYRNARDLLSDAMDGTGVSAELISLAGRHVAEKRLISNLRNEYDVFANRLLGPENAVPELKPDRLFAMVLYKNIHMADFDDIRIGQSKLDELHQAWQKLVEHCVDERTAKTAELARRLHALDAVATKSADLGERLQVLAKIAVPNEKNPRVIVAEKFYPFAEFTNPDLWYAITKKNPVRFANHQGSGQRPLLKFEDLCTVLGDALDPDKWRIKDRSALERERSARQEELAFLRHHSWQKIYARPEFTAPTSPEHGPESFSQLTERLMGSALACELVAAGYIDHYFALNISMYYGRHLSRDAQIFVMRALEQGEPHHTLYPLKPEDIDSLLKDKGEEIVGGRRAYNVWILDHLLAENDARAQAVITHISTWNETDKAFTDRYLANATHTDKFVAALAPLFSGILTYLVSEADVEEPQRVTLVSTALGHLDDKTKYAWDDDVARFVDAHYTDFAVLTGAVPEQQASQAMAMIATMGLRLPSVAPLNAAARQAAIADGTYQISQANLTVLTGSSSIALNELHESDARVYDTALARLPQYLDAIRAADVQPSVTSREAFPGILHQAETAIPDDDRAAAELVHLAAEDCRVESLTAAPTRTWPALAADGRTAPTAQNLIAYLDAFGALDAKITRVLTDIEAITDHENVADTDRARLALAILNAGSHLPSPRQRTHLAASLNTADLDPDEINPESGPFAGLLIEQNIIADNTETFASNIMVDWETRELAIMKSKKFEGFLGPDVLPSHDVGAFFTSPHIPTPLKDKVLKNIGAYIEASSGDIGNAVARYAVKSQATLAFEQLVALHHGRTSSHLLVEVIAAAKTLWSKDLRTLLRSMGGNYARIADHGSKRPKVPDDAAHRAILQRLEEEGIVSSFSKENGELRVSLRRG